MSIKEYEPRMGIGVTTRTVSRTRHNPMPSTSRGWRRFKNRPLNERMDVQNVWRRRSYRKVA